MVEVGDRAPDFSVPLAAGEITSFTLSNRLEEAPLVLVFFPAAFTGTCTTELKTFTEHRSAFEAAGATVYGVSVDSPYVLNVFRDAESLSMGLLSDFNRAVIEAYDLETALTDPDLHRVADRAIVIVDADQRVAWQWRAPDPGHEPAYGTVIDAVEGVTEPQPEGVNRGDDEGPV